jgi:FkbM family methyltransferase
MNTQKNMLNLNNLFNKYGKPHGILHVGANTGQEADTYNSLGIHTVLWIEADPEIYQQLVAHVSRYGHHAENYAAGDREGTVTLHVANNDGLSSSVLELGTHSVDHPTVAYLKDIEVPIRRIPPSSMYDFLVLDTQGYELEVLKGMMNHVTNFKGILSEINRNEVYKGCVLVDELDTYLGNYGFRRVETVWNNTTGWGEGFYIKESLTNDR